MNIESFNVEMSRLLARAAQALDEDSIALSLAGQVGFFLVTASKATGANVTETLDCFELKLAQAVADFAQA